MRWLARTVVAVATTALVGISVQAHGQERRLTVVGTWGFLDNWRRIEQPFWAEALPTATGGQLTADAKAVTEAGRTGPETLQALAAGEIDIAAVVPTYAGERGAIFEAVDLAGVTQDVAVLRESMSAWLPRMQRAMQRRYHAQILATFAFPQQALLCRTEIRGVGDIKDKTIRVQRAPQADLMEALGAKIVRVPFGEVPAALEKGSIDCAITGTAAAFEAQWGTTTRSLYLMPLGYTAGFWAVNTAVWRSLAPAQRVQVRAALGQLEVRSWQLAESLSADGIACLTGSGPCPLGDAAGLKLVSPGKEDQEAIAAAVRYGVLPAWASRCGPECTAAWNATIGARHGLVASTR